MWKNLNFVLLICMILLSSSYICFAKSDSVMANICSVDKPGVSPNNGYTVGWPYPRYDLENTGASPFLGHKMIQTPTPIWTFTGATNMGFAPLYPVAADVDDDGNLEFVIGVHNYQMGEHRLYALNCEDSSLLWEYNVGEWFWWSTPVIADLNKDGQLDIVLATDKNVLAIDGKDTTLIWKQPFPDGGMGMTVADVDDDDSLEIVVNDYGTPKKIYLLNGQDGTVIWEKETSGSAYNIPTVADVNGDGRKEILCHNHLYDPSREQEYCWDSDGNILWTFLCEPSDYQSANAPPELGYCPDFGYISTSVADFNGDGNKEIGFGSRCHYYVLDGNGKLIWKVPLVQGHGIFVTHHSDGTITPDVHGTGGPFGYAAAVGDINGDGATDIVLSLKPELRVDYYEETGERIYSQNIPANKVIALDGRDGNSLWEFEGEYLSEDSLEFMIEPILADVDGDGLLDIITYSLDGYIYAVNGKNGKKNWDYPAAHYPEAYLWHLTFVVNQDQGMLIYETIEYYEDYSQPKIIALAMNSTEVQDDVDDVNNPICFSLSQNYPNPFNTVTRIQFRVKSQEFREPIPTTLRVYNILGQKVKTFVDEPKGTGDYEVIWDGKDENGKEVASGIYLYQLKAGDFTETRKMILLK